MPRPGVAAFIVAASIARVAPSGTDWYPYDHTAWATSVDNHAFLCKDGSEQSPVDLPNCPSPVDRRAPTITWKTQDVAMENNGHTVTVKVKSGEAAPGGMSFYVGGKLESYTLVQCHVHAGSEHTVGGMQYPFESHCVHAYVTEQEAPWYGVFGVFWELNASVPSNAIAVQFLNQFTNGGNGIPTHKSSVDKRRLSDPWSFNVMGEPLNATSKRRLEGTVNSTEVAGFNFQLLTAELDLAKYYSYKGSFTTPPCTEAVDFYIFQKPLQMTEHQLNAFQVAIGWRVAGGNFRPPQPLNERTVYGCHLMEPQVDEQPWYPYRADHWAEHVGWHSSHAVCDGGSQQSPIDFAPCAVPSDRNHIDITWSTQTVLLSNNGHTIQLTANGPDPGNMTVGGKTYTLVQCHFHFPSEHTVGDKQYPFEAHCVHQQETNNEAKRYGVFGLFYELGDGQNAFLTQLLTLGLPTRSGHGRRLKGTPTQGVAMDLFGNPLSAVSGRRLAASAQPSDWQPLPELDFKDLYGDNPRTKFWDYMGSFTTPPCTEAVDFYIMMDPATITVDQLALFKNGIGWTAEGGNFRPPQPLGSRIVSGCSRLAHTENVLADHVAKEDEAKAIENFAANLEAVINEQVKTTLKEKQGGPDAIFWATFALAAVTIPLVLVNLALARKLMNGAQARA